MEKEKLDRLVWEITRPMWFLLSLLAVYILYLTYNTYIDPTAHISLYRMIPEMTEHLLAGCVVTAGLGTAFEFLSDKEL